MSQLIPKPAILPKIQPAPEAIEAKTASAQPTPARSIPKPAKVRLARLVSLGLHPFLMAPLSIVLVLYLNTGHLWGALGWAGLCAAFVVAPAMLYLKHGLSQKHLSDADVSVREQRHRFYLFGAACMAVCFAVFWGLGAPPVLLAFFTAALMSVVAAAAITRLWTKVSIHAGVMAGATVAVAFYSLPWAVGLAGCTVVVAWARLVLKRHTLLQAVLGGLVALVCVSGVFGVML